MINKSNRAKSIARVLVSGLLLTGCLGYGQIPRTQEPPKHYPWSDTSLSPDARADLVIKEMTLDEKISLLHGQRAFGPRGATQPPSGSNGGAGFSIDIPRLGIPAIQMADSAYGVTRGAFMGRYSTALPNNLAAASSWDTQMAFEYGQLIGRELRDQGYSMSLGGGVDLTREPRNGRTFEYQGEDPLLAGTLDGYVEKGVQSEHIIGDLKHYALNDQESGRNAVNANIDKRSMRETDLRAFEIALGISDAGGVMCSYNRVNGDYACENSYLLTDILKKDFMSILRTYAAFLAGTNRMKWRAFLLFNAAGGIVWSAIYSFAAYYAGSTLRRSSHEIDIAVGATAAVVLVGVVIFVRHQGGKFRERAEAAYPGPLGD